MIRFGGRRVIEGVVSLVLHGAWAAELELDGEDAPSGAGTLEADAAGLSLRGTVVEAVPFVGRTHTRVVGGAGKLGVHVGGSYQSAKLRDPLQAILAATGDRLSSTVDQALLTRALPLWTLGNYPAWRALGELAAFAGEAVHWRYLEDGTLWLGAETWPAVRLRAEDALVDRLPLERRVVIAGATPWLLPGVELEDVGRVVGVDHWLSPQAVRTWAWTS